MTRPHPRRYIARLALLLMVAAGARTAAAAPPIIPEPAPAAKKLTPAEREEAEALWTRLDACSRRSDHACAEKAARRLFDLSPNAFTALVLATVVGDDLGDACRGFALWLTALELGPESEADRAKIESGLARHGAACAPGYGWVVVEVDPPDAELSLAGVSVARRVFGLPAGAHTVTARAPGRSALDQDAAVRAGHGARLAFKLLADDLATRTRKPASRSVFTRWWFWTGVGVLAAATVAVIVVAGSGDAHAPSPGGGGGVEEGTVRFP